MVAQCFLIVVIKNLEGERDYGQQTLATRTFLRSQLRRGVVNMVVVNAKVQVVKRMCLSKSLKSCVYVTRNRFAHTK